MLSKTEEQNARTNGSVLAEGKTKMIVKFGADDGTVSVVSKDDITAGDGAKHDIIEGKAALATQTTCNVFRLLKEAGIPVAFKEQLNGTTFSAPFCKMLPYEVVVRREAHGSYLKRMPILAKGHHFPKLVVEFFLKTSGKKWKEHDLWCDDPLMIRSAERGEIDLYEPSKPIHSQRPFMTLKESEVFSNYKECEFFPLMEKMAVATFLVLEKAWHIEGRKLVDFKVEFGLDKDSKLLLADVIDNDSWRVLENGAYIDKQVYREGGNIADVAENYRRVAEITGRFRIPVQQVIIWSGSDKDDVSPILTEIERLSKGHGKLRRKVVVRSIHKEPVRGVIELDTLVQEIPDSVIIAFIGRSNGAGPTLSAATTVPVITIPASVKDFREDVWSSLRTPSSVPVMTVLEPTNAALAALQILALNNPLLYMLLREHLEWRLVNTVLL